MTASASAQTTLRYDCYIGAQVPYYDGTQDNIDTIASCEVTDAMVSAASAGQVVSANVYDVWWVHSGANRICLAMSSATGGGGGWIPDSGSNTARNSTGYTGLDRVTRPYITNKNSIANCFNGATNYGSVTANQATYLGTVYASANGQVSWIFGAAAAGGTAGLLGVWNMYNRVGVDTTVEDTYTISTVTSGTIVPLDNGGTGSGLNNRVSYVVGIAEDTVTGFMGASANAGASGFVGVYVGHDSASAISGIGGINANPLIAPVAWSFPENADVGFHFMQALQSATTSNGATYGSGQGDNIHSGLRLTGKF
jgi:hypothetical protein